MKKRSASSVSVSEGNNDESQPQQPSSCVVESHAEKEKGEQTLVPPNPKLDDGFYEIETIRRKRVRKGEVQYLIKWRGWPETANTWEPLENLQSVPDLVDAFEDSLKSGKHRRRKRKHVVHHTLPKKRLQRSTTSYGLRHFPTDNHLQTLICADQGQTNADPTSPAQPKPANVNGFAKHEENDCEYDPKLSELKATTNCGIDADKLAIHFQQPKVSSSNCHVDGQPKVDCVEPVQNGRCRGAKRRKSGSVKRFKKETYACDPVDSHNAISMSVGAGELGTTGIAGYMGDAKTACNIVKIIKPIGYSASLSDNIQDVSVTFMAMRSDGTEVMVDNKYLKAYDPLLLINFYELHLRYSPTL
ncbi:hypothetical protein VNO77_11738 [Canavalia gladiata]|uniref:Chromo domain-containing protein n=1 Tax=Canavalia gladiata TaxID=3824 RepID=A0AAN9QXU7_CANGL